MKTKGEINKDILAITIKIEEQFPEFSKYISETPMEVSFGADPKITLTNLQDYYVTLNALLKNYTENHSAVLTGTIKWDV